MMMMMMMMMKRTEVITVQWKNVPYIYHTTCKEMFPNIDANLDKIPAKANLVPLEAEFFAD